jgi:hypothetical protein
VTSAPELSELDWDEAENLTDRIAESPAVAMPLRWEDDEVTMPRRDDDLRAQARAIAAVNEARREAARRQPGSSTSTGPNGTLVDETREDAASQAKTLVGRGDTLVDVDPPSEVESLPVSERPPSISGDPIDSIVEDDAPEASMSSAAPSTQPSTPPPALSEPARSIEIDLAELELQRDSLPSLLDADDDGDFEHTPAPRALRTPSTAPGPVGSSFPPVAVDEQVPPPPMKSGGRLGWVALGTMLALCAGVLAFVFYPRGGGLDVRLNAADGEPVAKAEIFVDGRKVCDTDPCIVNDMTPGEHAVKVLLPGHDEAIESSVRVKRDEQARLTIDLPALEPTEQDAPPAEPSGEEPSHPGVRVEVVTEGARVVLVQGGDTRVIPGPWPKTLDLEPGSYKLVASRYGYEPFVHRFTVDEESSLQKVSVELEAATKRRAETSERAPAGTNEPAKTTPPAPSAAPEPPDSDGDIYED